MFWRCGVCRGSKPLLFPLSALGFPLLISGLLIFPQNLTPSQISGQRVREGMKREKKESKWRFFFFSNSHLQSAWHSQIPLRFPAGINSYPPRKLPDLLRLWTGQGRRNLGNFWDWEGLERFPGAVGVRGLGKVGNSQSQRDPSIP